MISSYVVHLCFNTSEISSDSDKEEIEEFVKYIAKKPAVAACVDSSPSEINNSVPAQSNPIETQNIGENTLPNDIVQTEDEQDSMINNDPREEFDEDGNKIERIPSSAFEDIVIDD